MSEPPPSKAEMARIAGVENATLRTNINMLLKMVVNRGYTIVEQKTKNLRDVNYWQNK